MWNFIAGCACMAIAQEVSSIDLPWPMSVGLVLTLGLAVAFMRRSLTKYDGTD